MPVHNMEQCPRRYCAEGRQRLARYMICCPFALIDNADVVERILRRLNLWDKTGKKTCS